MSIYNRRGSTTVADILVKSSISLVKYTSPWVLWGTLVAHHHNILGNVFCSWSIMCTQKWHVMVKNVKTWDEILFTSQGPYILYQCKKKFCQWFCVLFLVIFESTSSGNMLLNCVSCKGISVIVQLQRLFSQGGHIYLLH